MVWLIHGLNVRGAQHLLLKDKAHYYSAVKYCIMEEKMKWQKYISKSKNQDYGPKQT